MTHGNYPRSVQDILVKDKKYKPQALKAVRRFAKSKPWRGSLSERQTKFRQLNHGLAEAYGIREPNLIFGQNVPDNSDSGSSCYIPSARAIILRGRLSVITYLHEFAHCLYGSDERIACRWSVNLFRRCFPRSWQKIRFDGHMVRRVE